MLTLEAVRKAFDREFPDAHVITTKPDASALFCVASESHESGVPLMVCSDANADGLVQALRTWREHWAAGPPQEFLRR